MERRRQQFEEVLPLVYVAGHRVATFDIRTVCHLLDIGCIRVVLHHIEPSLTDIEHMQERRDESSV